MVGISWNIHVNASISILHCGRRAYQCSTITSTNTNIAEIRRLSLVCQEHLLSHSQSMGNVCKPTLPLRPWMPIFTAAKSSPTLWLWLLEKLSHRPPPHNFRTLPRQFSEPRLITIAILSVNQFGTKIANTIIRRKPLTSIAITRYWFAMQMQSWSMHSPQWWTSYYYYYYG